MSGLPLAIRVVEVIADRGEAAHPRYQYGSGCVVAGRTVLTAAHVVAGAASVKVRDPGKVLHEAVLDPGFVGDVDGPGPDLALVEISGPVTGVPAMGLAAVDRDSVSGDPVERCHVVGYPAFMEREAPDGGRFRETADAFGHVPVLSGLAGGLLSVQVSSAPRPLPAERIALGDSQWSGMSGGPVVADGLLLGVVTEHAPRAGSSAITATPLTALEANPAHPGWGPGVPNPGAWWSRLGSSGAHTLQRLPAPRQRAEPAYWATAREIHQRTATLVGRHNELAEIASFATGTEGYRWLAGGAWAGKTSLLAEAVTVLQSECDVVCYFLSRREADADSSRFLAAVVPQLAYLLKEDPPAAELHQFRALWQRAAQRADAEDRHLLLVVDGLDEDLHPPGLPSVAALLPPSAAVTARAHVLVSSRPHPELPSDLPPGHRLTHMQPVPVEPFGGAQKLAELARQEIDDLLRRDDDGLAADVLGLLTAAAGPLAVADLAAMTVVAPQSAALTRRIRRLVTAAAARSLEPAGLAGRDRYQFAHGSLLEHAQANIDLSDPDFLDRIHRWADSWRAAGWPSADGDRSGTPWYLLDTYSSTLTRDPQRLAVLVSDAGWIEAGVRSVGVDGVLADLRTAVAANPASSTVAAMLAAVTGQAHYLRPPHPVDEPGYVLRQLCMQASELLEGQLADDLRRRLRSRPGLCLVPLWTTRRASPALPVELGRYDGSVGTMAVLVDGQVVIGGSDGRVLTWDPTAPAASWAELGRHDGQVRAAAVLADGRVVTTGDDGRVLVWDRTAPSGPVELGRRDGWVGAVAVLADGRVVTGGADGLVLVWDPAAPGRGPVELGRHEDQVLAAAIADGRVVTGGGDGRVLVWDPAAPGRRAELGRHDGWVLVVAVLADGRVITGGHDGRVLAWDPAASGRRAELGRHDGWVLAVAVLADGRVVTGGDDGRVLAWDPAASGRRAELGRHDSWTWAVAALADGRVVTGGADGRVLVWDPAASGRGPVELGRHDSWVGAVAALADGRVLTGGDDGRVLGWDPAAPGRGPVELGRHDSRVRAVAALADGRVVTGWADGRVLAWDPAAPGADPAHIGRHDGQVRAVAVLADGRVVTGGDDGRVLAWDPAVPGRGPVELGRHDGWVWAVAVLADGRVVTGGNDGRVLVWDPVTPGRGPAELGRHDGWVRAVAVLADGQVVTGGEDRRVLVWNPSRTGTSVVQLGCSVTTLDAAPLGPAMSCLVITHQGTGFSTWSLTM